MRDHVEEIFSRIVESIDSEDPAGTIRALAKQLDEDLEIEALELILTLETIADVIDNREEKLLRMGHETVEVIMTEIYEDDLWFNDMVESMQIESITDMLELEGEVAWYWQLPEEEPCKACGLAESTHSALAQRTLELEVEVRRLKEEQRRLALVNAELLSRVRRKSEPGRASKEVGAERG